MKLSQILASVAAAVLTSFFSWENGQASSFGEQPVEQEQFVLMATPYRYGYNLLIVEQIPGQRPCWQEIGANPTKIAPLLLNFDFTGVCKRSSDSNGYSIRLDGQDLGMDYLTNIVKKDGELHLIGTARNPQLPELQIGRTYGLSSGALKIILNQGWSLSKRIYGKKTLEHVYLSRNSNPVEQSKSQPVSVDRKIIFNQIGDR